LTQAELLAGFKRQLSMELACTVTINSVEAAKPLTENMAKMVIKLTSYLPSSLCSVPVLMPGLRFLCQNIVKVTRCKRDVEDRWREIYTGH